MTMTRKYTTDDHRVHELDYVDGLLRSLVTTETDLEQKAILGAAQVLVRRACIAQGCIGCPRFGTFDEALKAAVTTSQARYRAWAEDSRLELTDLGNAALDDWDRGWDEHTTDA